MANAKLYSGIEMPRGVGTREGLLRLAERLGVKLTITEHRQWLANERFNFMVEGEAARVRAFGELLARGVEEWNRD